MFVTVCNKNQFVDVCFMRDRNFEQSVVERELISLNEKYSKFCL